MRVKGLSAYLTLHLAYFVFSLAVLSMKFASTFPFGSVPFLRYYLLSIAFMVIYAFFWQKVLSVYPLTRAYSWKALVFLWVFLYSIVLFREPLTWKNILGAVLIVSGLIMVNDHE